MFGEDPPEREAREGAPLVALPWVLVIAVTLVALAALAALGWLFFDRQGVRDELVAAQGRVAELRNELSAADFTRERLRAQVDQLEDLGGTAIEARQACRRAVQDAVRMWNDLVRAINAATKPSVEDFERFSKAAEDRRQDVNRSLEECERATGA